MRIRVKAVIPFPKGHTDTPRYARHSGGKATRKQQRAAWLVLGPPVEPGHRGVCGTDLVWPVLEVEGIPKWKMIDIAYVCRHQIIIGD